MALKRRIPYIIVVLLLLIYLTFFILCTSSLGATLGGGALTFLGPNRIAFAAGSYPVDTQNLTTVLQSGETALLEEFTGLVSADFSGSTCYEEIINWANAHPEVSVRYTVTLPTGSVADNKTAALDLTGLRHEDVPAAVTCLRFLPAVTSVDLGSSSQTVSPVNAEDLSALRTAKEGLSLSYAVDFLGKSWPLTTQEADLTGLTSASVPETAAGLSMLSGLTRIRIADNATTDGSLAWEDLTAISQAAPSAVLDYKFSVCGVEATMADTSIDLSAIQPSDIQKVLAILPAMTQLKNIDLGNDSNGLSLDQIDAIGNIVPEATISYSTSVYGQPINLSDTYIDLNHISVSDEGAAIRKILPHMKNLTGLDMDSCGVSDQAMAQIRDENPSVSVVWRVWFGNNYSCRTDVIKILASKPSKGGRLNNSNTSSLKYCTKVRYLDLGHNEDLSDFSFLAKMPDLQIAVLSMTGISDLTPISNCKDLIYLEMGNTPRVHDISPLSSCTKLRHLNIGTNPQISDISPLYDIPLIRLWIGIATPIPQSQVDEYQSRNPGCIINTTVAKGTELDENGDLVAGFTGGDWKTYQKYLLHDWDVYAAYGYFPDQRPIGYFKVVYLALEYQLKEGAYAFTWNDPLYNEHNADVQPVNMHIVDVSLLSEEWHEDPNIITPIYPEDESYG